MKNVIVPIFVPHMGCPHACVFCNQFHITGQWAPPNADTLKEKARAWKESAGMVPELAFYGGSFTAINLEIQNKLLEIASELKANGEISRIRLSTRPDALGEEVLERLKKYHVDTVEIGVQSMDADVLLAAGRGHTVDTTVNAIRRVKRYGFNCGAQMMVALPGDTPEKSIETCRQVISLSPDFVRIYPTAVIKDTELEKMYNEGRYIPWTFDLIIDTVAEMVMLLEAKKIPAIRIGLQAEDQLTNGDVVAGAYHPALGEYVKSRIFRKKMEALLNPIEKEEICFNVGPKYVSQAIGQHRENIKYLMDKSGQKITVKPNDQILGNGIERR